MSYFQNHKFTGCGTALVTPFESDGSVALETFSELINWQIESGVDFLVPCGTTGESPTLTNEEYQTVIKQCVETADGRVPILAGAGTNDTRHAIQLSEIAQENGADGVLSVTPYYNKPSHKGLLQHYGQILETIDIPLVLYNVPSRTSLNMEVSTIAEISQHPGVIGLKDAGGNLEHTMRLLELEPEFLILSGDDAVTLPMISIGAQGVISVASNVIPAEMAGLVKAAREGNSKIARDLHYRYIGLMDILFIESSPMPVKYALAQMAKIKEVYRLPMCPLLDESKVRVTQELLRIGLTV
jgi:4-hydroxy-tetrahydrodipicolinate synthase